MQLDEVGTENGMVRGLAADGLLERIHLSRSLRDRNAGLETGEAEVIVVSFDFRELIGGPAEGDEGFQGVAGATETAEQLSAGEGEACG